MSDEQSALCQPGPQLVALWDVQRITSPDRGAVPALGFSGGTRRSGISYSVPYQSVSSGLSQTITNALSQQTTLRYDPANRPRELAAPDGKLTRLAYDAAGNMIRSTVRGQDSLQLTSIYSYTADNQLQAERRPNGIITSYAYNARGQLLRTIVNEQTGGVNLNQPDKHLVTEYGYDPLQRLTEATETPGTSERYTYDLVGNRTQVWINGAPQPVCTYDAANQVVGGSYDAAGNLLSDGTRTLTYDALNRLTRAATSGTTTSYRYTGDGVLTSQTTNSTTTTYPQDLIATLSQVLEQRTVNTTTSYRYGRERLAAVAGSTRTWYGTDALGSLRQTLTDSGSASAPIHYDPWGTPTQGTPPTFGFTGEVQDATSGLIHLRARWYVPGQATFTSRDPFAGFPTQPYSLHLYQYGYNNPILYTDPSGRTSCDGPNCPPTWDEEIAYCGTGILSQWGDNNYFGQVEQLQPQPYETDTTRTCRYIGDALSLAQGSAEMAGGSGMISGGLAACATGVGCVVGVPAIVAGCGVFAHGAAVTVQGTWKIVVRISEDVSTHASNSGGGSSWSAGARKILNDPDIQIDVNNLEVDPRSTTGQVLRQKPTPGSGIKAPSDKEVALADRLIRDGTVSEPILVTSKGANKQATQGIDGITPSGRLLQLKTLDSQSPGKVLERVNGSYTANKGKNYQGVEVYLEAPTFTRQQVWDRWQRLNGKPRHKYELDGTLANHVRVYAQDGIVDLPLIGPSQ